ncbi:MAG TPA: ComEC/Rec2 family competence protein, partial [Blastocatellia bacterium]|nr:ComEC/Rec2 family competence protein [Blastocatellia bacterium]
NSYFLDQQTSERLRASATFHALAISGFHVSLIAWVLLRLPVTAASLKSLKERSKLQRHGAVRTIVSMLALWTYAVMVGLAPPVTRAAVMITVGLMGPLIFRRSASVNTVSLAAFVMLVLKPALVADPGFQLSFVAVASIVGLALPLINTLRRVGEWVPAQSTPHPPKCSRAIKAFAETIFWDERKFDREMRHAPIRYRLDKARAAHALSRMRLQPVARGVVLLTITSISIQLCTLPLMAFYFNRVSPIGVVLNITAGLLTAVLMLTALGAIAVAPLSLWAAAHLASVVNAAHYLFAHSIDPFEAVPFAAFRVAHHEGWQAIIYALYFIPLMLLAVLIDLWRPVDHVLPIDRKHEGSKGKAEDQGVKNPSPPRRFTPPPLLVCCLALLALLVAAIRPAVGSPGGKLTVHFLDVGQGDAALVIFPRGATMLIDAGGESRFDNRGEEERTEEGSEPDFNDGTFSVGEAVVSRFLWSQGRTQIDYVLATHAHRDHIGGLSDVLKNFCVGQAIVGHAPADDSEFSRFKKAVCLNKITLSAVSAGERFELEGVTVEVLWPPRSSGEPVTSGNDDSVTVRLVYGSVAILLAGDIEQGAEESLVASGVDLRADVLKVPHHGSKTSSTDAFLDKVRPRCAVISVGERSRFGHPHAVVVNRYLERGVRLFQTGRDGMVTAETDGTTLDVVTYR